MAMCDARYCITILDIGAPGRESDGGVFSRSEFGKRFVADELDFPQLVEKLPGTDTEVPFFCVADAAFPLRTNLLKPYGGKNLSRKQMIFNYRLSRARRCIENCFGILAARWRLLRRQINAEPERVETFVKAACVLHNFLQIRDVKEPLGQRLYCPSGFVDSYAADGSVNPGQWRQDQPTNFINVALTNTPSNRYGAAAAALRDTFSDYFVSENGSVPWQNNLVFTTQ